MNLKVVKTSEVKHGQRVIAEVPINCLDKFSLKPKETARQLAHVANNHANLVKVAKLALGTIKSQHATILEEKKCEGCYACLITMPALRVAIAKAEK